MKHRGDGSATLLVLLLISTLTVLVGSLWRNISYAHEIVCEREQYEVEFRLLDALCLYAEHAVDVLKKCFVDNSSPKITCMFAHWPPAILLDEKKKHKYSGNIEFLLKDNNVEAKVQLKRHKLTIMTASGTFVAHRELLKEKVVGPKARYTMTPWLYNAG